jgi:uncharacterized protein YbaR (Trm112 family)
MSLGDKIMTVNKELLEILACPKCKGEIKLLEKSTIHKEAGFMCEPCKLFYPIKDGIPVMLIDEAIKVGEK